MIRHLLGRVLQGVANVGIGPLAGEARLRQTAYSNVDSKEGSC